MVELPSVDTAKFGPTRNGQWRIVFSTRHEATGAGAGLTRSPRLAEASTSTGKKCTVSVFALCMHDISSCGGPHVEQSITELGHHMLVLQTLYSKTIIDHPFDQGTIILCKVFTSETQLLVQFDYQHKVAQFASPLILSKLVNSDPSPSASDMPFNLC